MSPLNVICITLSHRLNNTLCKDLTCGTELFHLDDPSPLLRYVMRRNIFRYFYQKHHASKISYISCRFRGSWSYESWITVEASVLSSLDYYYAFQFICLYFHTIWNLQILWFVFPSMTIRFTARLINGYLERNWSTSRKATGHFRGYAVAKGHVMCCRLWACQQCEKAEITKSPTVEL